MATPNKEVKYTQRDLEQLTKAFSCMKDDAVFALDYTKFATACGFANANSAKASWNNLKKKLDKAGGDDVTISMPDGGVGASGKKRKAASTDEADENGDTPATPVAKKSRTPAKAKATPKKAAANAGEGEANEADVVVKPEDDEHNELAAPTPAATPATPKARKPRTPKAKKPPVAATKDAADGEAVKTEDAARETSSADAAAPVTTTPKPKGRKAATPAKAKTPAKKVIKAEVTDDKIGDGDETGDRADGGEATEEVKDEERDGEKA